MKRETVKYKSEAEWLDLKSRDVTSTESSALFGLNQYMTELELYHLKKSGEVRAFDSNERMRWGQRLEASIAEGVSEELSCDVSPFKNYIRMPEVRMGASFDYEILSGKYKDWLMEVKNVDSLIFKQQWSETEATDYIETQVQHQMEVADRPGCLVVALVGGNRIFYIPRERDLDVGKALKNRIKKFWQDIESGNEPSPDYERDADFIIGLHQASGGEVLDGSGNETLVDLIKSYHEITQDITENDKEAKAIKAQILEIIGDGPSKVLVDGYSLSCSMTKNTPPTVITDEMIGQTYGGRKGFRNFRITK
ncbi:MAG: YqaJ viral recombinase family protein, partial [bacterium]